LDDPIDSLDAADNEIAMRAISRLSRFVSGDGVVQRVQLNEHTTLCQKPNYWVNRPDVVEWIANDFRREDWEVSVMRANGQVALNICAKR
jgi:hypothetical protein